MMKIFKVIIFIALCCNLVSSASAAPSISLEGSHKFSSGDDSNWARAEYNDTDWQPIDIPGSWQTKGVTPQNGKGWYRIRFFLPMNFEGKDLAVLLGEIGNIDETFLNGVKIGSTGKFGKWFLDALIVERLYKLPSNLLKFNSENVLAVRVMSVYWHGGILNAPVKIDDYSSLLVGKLKRDFYKKAQEIVFILTFLLALLACFFFYFEGIKKSELFYFSGMLAALLFAYTIGTLIFYETGLKNVFIQNFSLFIYVMIPINFLGFVLKIFKAKFNMLVKGIIAYGILLAVLLGVFGTYNYNVYTWLSNLWVIQLILVAMVVIVVVIKAYRDKMEDSKAILLCIILLLVSGIIEIMAGLNILPFKSAYVNQYPILLFIVVMLYAFIQRFMRLKSKNEMLSSRILSAYEDERKRLSRELHDGLGQSFLAVKLNLQRINQNSNNTLIDGTIKDIAEGINQLRDISQGLHPPFLEEMGLAPALELYGQKYSKQTGIKVLVKTDYKSRQSTLIEENFFRIFQEALSNVAKHSEADTISVSLYYAKDSFIMEIFDNGQGFDYGKIYSSAQGQGLRTIKERVNLIDGVLKYKFGQGTNIRVEVPLS